jgi:hypothetical protein
MFLAGEYHWRLIARVNRLTDLCNCLGVVTNTLDSCKAAFEAEHTVTRFPLLLRL